MIIRILAAIGLFAIVLGTAMGATLALITLFPEPPLESDENEMKT